MVNVKRKKGETFESMFRRFNKHLIKSGTILEFKQRRYRVKPPTRNARKTSKVVSLEIRARKEYLKRIGQLDETETRRRRW